VQALLPHIGLPGFESCPGLSFSYKRAGANGTRENNQNGEREGDKDFSEHIGVPSIVLVARTASRHAAMTLARVCGPLAQCSEALEQLILTQRGKR
jgi:hypothetical protein